MSVLDPPDRSQRLAGCVWVARECGADPDQAQDIARRVVDYFAHWPSSQATAEIMAQCVVDLADQL